MDRYGPVQIAPYRSIEPVCFPDEQSTQVWLRWVYCASGLLHQQGVGLTDPSPPPKEI